MAQTFIPFFEKPAGQEAAPPEQFTQYKLSKVTLAQSQPPPQFQVQAHVIQGASSRRVDHSELKTKLLSDLESALSLSLPDEAVQQILSDLDRARAAESPGEDLGDASGSDASSETGGSAGKPNIRLEKEGDKVTNIVVECECGQIIALDCIY